MNQNLDCDKIPLEIPLEIEKMICRIYDEINYLNIYFYMNTFDIIQYIKNYEYNTYDPWNLLYIYEIEDDIFNLLYQEKCKILRASLIYD